MGPRPGSKVCPDGGEPQGGPGNPPAPCAVGSEEGGSVWRFVAGAIHNEGGSAIVVDPEGRLRGETRSCCRDGLGVPREIGGRSWRVRGLGGRAPPATPQVPPAPPPQP